MSKRKEQPVSQIPAGWLRLLKWFCPAHLNEGIEGDLAEQYDADRATVGDRIARRRLYSQVLYAKYRR
jgi:hypothetical protein